MESTKKTTTFSLDPNIREFVDDTHWDFKKSRSEFVNTILEFVQKDTALLERIFVGTKRKPKEKVRKEQTDLFEL